MHVSQLETRDILQRNQPKRNSEITFRIWRQKHQCLDFNNVQEKTSETFQL